MSEHPKTQPDEDGGGIPPRKTRVGASDDSSENNVLKLAQEEARRLGHNYVGTEMILLGFLREGACIAAQALKAKGLRLHTAREEVEKIIGRGSGFVAVEIPFTPRSKRLLELSWEEARALGDNSIGSEHLLFGLLKQGEGMAVKVLDKFGVDLEELRSETMKIRAEKRVK